MKRIRQNNVRRTRNRHFKSMMRTRTKLFRATIDAGDLEAANEMFTSTIGLIHKLATKGIIHKNQAARRVSRLQLLLNKAQA
jgi:small subunit ribosomal protein S20